MKITSLKLSGYRRFSLNNLTNFEITPTSNIQIVLGTNGSGKSSLLEALSPYPQAKSDFLKGGHKILEIEHNNSSYVLTSLYTSGAKHAFEKNGVNLNDGGTASVQKELVERELGITSQLHELLTGKIKFTDMTPIQRREWIMRISNIDLNFAMDKYNDIKDRLRDAQGALKHEEVRLGRESQRLLDSVNIESMKEENITLQKHISFYLKEIKNDIPSYEKIESEYNDICNAVESSSAKLLKMNFDYEDKSKLVKFDDILEREQFLSATDKALKAVLLELEIQLKEDKSVLAQLKKEGITNKEELEIRLKKNLEDRNQYLKETFIFEIEGDLNQVLKDSKSLRITLSELVSEAKGDSIIVPERATWDQYKLNLIDTQKTIQIKDNRLTVILKRKEEIENSQKNECPKCKYTWQPGISERDLILIDNEIKSLNIELKDLKEKENELSIICKNIDIRMDEINRFKALAHSYPRLRKFWTHVAEMKYLYLNPKDIFYTYDKWIKEIETLIEMETLDEKIDSIKTTLKSLENETDKVDIEFFTKREKVLSGKINDTLIKIESNQECLNSLLKYKKKHIEVSEDVHRLTTLIQKMKDLEYQIIESKIQEEISKRLDVAQMTLSNNRRRQTEVDTLNGIVEDLKKSIEGLKIDISSLTNLEKALSPTDGLIAEALTGFINSFVTQLNVLISSIWEYSMEIIPCTNTSGELDFRFPLKVMDQPTPVFDIAKGSEGQREVINFMFLLTVLAYTGLKDFPLFLDEIGSAFDDAHKSKLVMFIKSLLDSTHCSQIWLVSHFAADHGGLTDSQTCVMDSANIAVPDKANLHVVMS